MATQTQQGQRGTIAEQVKAATAETAAQAVAQVVADIPAQADPFAGIVFKLATDMKPWKAKNGKLGRTMVHYLIPVAVLGVPTFVHGSLEARYDDGSTKYELESFIGGLIGRYPSTNALTPDDDSVKLFNGAVTKVHSKAVAFVKAEALKGNKLDMRLSASVRGGTTASADDLGM